ncbi:NUDIX domain-containing protein [Cupriavidus sp. KK10]|uniref:NUDIX domain-containing protein n=1 Tax=Cupriavidus sp. KK10 TaxID=1478019 RepID=UPI002013BB4F|nr:NUDIX domain-containing protein [Cupriavidus sp. KK10]
MKLKIRATAICFRQDRLLLVSKDGVKWALPGGRPAENESLAEAAQRELEEETTLSAKGVGFLFKIIVPTTVHYVFLANIRKTAVPKPRQGNRTMPVVLPFRNERDCRGHYYAPILWIHFLHDARVRLRPVRHAVQTGPVRA